MPKNAGNRHPLGELRTLFSGAKAFPDRPPHLLKHAVTKVALKGAVHVPTRQQQQQ